LALSCTHSDKGDIVSSKKLIGRYVYLANPIDTIDVNSDGSYSYYKWWYGNKLQNSGTWLYDSLEGRMNFANFSFLTDTMEFLGGPGRGNWNTRIQSKNKELRFIYATDIYQGYYLKIDSIDRIQ
jgi:hypothetical protein